MHCIFKLHDLQIYSFQLTYLSHILCSHRHTAENSALASGRSSLSIDTGFSKRVDVGNSSHALYSEVTWVSLW